MVHREASYHKKKVFNVSLIHHDRHRVVVIPAPLIEARLRPSLLTIYSIVASINQTQEHYATKQSIGELVDLSSATIDRALKQLEASGWVQVLESWYSYATDTFHDSPLDGERLGRLANRYKANLKPGATN